MGYLLDYSQNFLTYGSFTNVKQFGAQGNGTTDDTAAIQSALNSGGTIYFPPGTYLITSGLTATNVNIVGAGANVSVINANITSGTALTLSSTTYQTLQNIGLQGTNTTLDSSNTSIGLLIQGSGNGTAPESLSEFMSSLYNVSIYNFGTAFELGNNAWANKFYNCGFASSNVGINLAGGTNNGEDIAFFGCTIYNNITGVLQSINYAFDYYFHSCSFDYNQQYLLYSANNFIKSVNFISCHFEMNPPTNNIIAPIYITTPNYAAVYILGGTFNPQGTWTSTNAFIETSAGVDGKIEGLAENYSSTISLGGFIYNGTDYFAKPTGGIQGLFSFTFNNGQMGYTEATVGSSPFTFQNNQIGYGGQNNEQVLIVGGVITEITLNGTSLNTSTSSLILTPNDTLIITYTTAPTIYYTYI